MYFYEPDTSVKEAVLPLMIIAGNWLKKHLLPYVSK
jgi:hypothetical protein